jgi:uncharacterized 2Fe-2S/4Fe-4S cluster protein (DUF4445 family)
VPPLIAHIAVTLPLPGPDDRRAHDQRLRDALGIEGRVIPLSLLNQLASELKAGNTGLTCTVGMAGQTPRLIDLGCPSSYSLALDLGTTNMVFLLIDNRTGTSILAASFENPQICFGSDILTRMHHAMSPRAQEVYDVLMQGIDRALGTLCERAGIARKEIHALVMAGNTVMSHFFLGLDISTIPVDPFVPVVRTPGFFAARELNIGINAEALVYVFPNAGSYVGGDIVAGVIAAGIDREDRPSVLIDVGTNAEVVIGTKDWMIVGAGAAGPALEEGISRIGKRASRGIIYDVEIRENEVVCKTFDEQPPEGICGSGMVSLLASLHGAGIIDQRGTLDRDRKNVMQAGDEPAYAIDCGCGGQLLIRQSEIQNFIKSKAAMFTLLLVLTRSVGIGFRDIAKVFVSGALGTGIDARKAVAIGMLPAWDPSTVRAMGNSSLEGAKMLLHDAGLLETIASVTDRITYKHMHDDPEFMKEFMGAVFIPHTNPALLKAE